MTIIVGINAYHGDAAACIIADGKLVAAAEEERFRRVKHWAGFPSQAIAYCLQEAGAQLSDVAHVAINSDPRANWGKKVAYALHRRPNPALILSRIKTRRRRASLEDELSHSFPAESFSGQIHRIEHHRAHLASAYYASPFEQSVIASVDGFGDFSSMAWGHASSGQMNIEGRTYFPHSLGIFYQALTQYLGFPNYGDEYKVMGLAPYGRPTYLNTLRNIVRLRPQGQFELDLNYFRHHSEQIDSEWTGGSPHVGQLFSPALFDLLGPGRKQGTPLEQKHRDMAHSIQAMYEEAFFHLLDHAHSVTGAHNLALAGGCGMNSVANGKVRRRSHFKQLYVQSAAGDAGGAIGAAYSVKVDLGDRRPSPMPHAYLGPHFSSIQIGNALESEQGALDAEACSVRHFEDEDALCETVASAIGEGKVIGWFQGRMEWGPRALGNRSILGDPRRADMKDILNLKIKRRESFRPFAPSILRDQVSVWFEEEDDVPFMMKVFQIRENKRKDIPAVTHADGSGRLQTVTPTINARYHRLISTFHKQTGVPILLNTSFNENEPVVCKPEEAIACFLRTKMDILVLGDTVISRQ